MKTWHWTALGLLTMISLLAEFTLLADYDSHWWDRIPGFYILWGFLGCLFLILISRLLAHYFFYKDELYYDR